MFLLVVSSRFKRNLKRFLRKYPKLEPIIKEKLNALSRDLRHKDLKTHKLTGRLKNFFAISITYEHRLIFSIQEDSLFLLAIVAHDEVY